MTDQKLLALAREAAAHSYSPYSHFDRGIECPSQPIHHEGWEVTYTFASP